METSLSFESNGSTSVEHIPTAAANIASDDERLESLVLYRIASALWSICSPIIILLGTFGNVMTLVIMRRMTSSESSLNVYFTSLAVVDLIVLFTASLPEWLNVKIGFRLQDTGTVSCKLFTWSSTGAGTMGSWFLVCLTLHRASAVVWPHRVNFLCTRRRVTGLIVGVAAFIATLYSHYIVGFDIVNVSNASTTTTTMKCLMASPGYVHFVRDVFVYVEVAVYSLLPFACLVLGNGVLVWKLSVSLSEARKNLTAGRAERVSARRGRAAKSVTLTVIVVSLTFVVLTLPVSFDYILSYIAREFLEVTGNEYAKVQLFYTVSVLLADCNSAVNFYLYCLTGRRFREEFLRVFGCGMSRCLPTATRELTLKSQRVKSFSRSWVVGCQGVYPLRQGK